MLRSRMRADPHQRVNKQEFAEMMSKAAARAQAEESESRKHAAVAQAFGEIDRDGDGSVTYGEVRPLVRMHAGGRRSSWMPTVLGCADPGCHGLAAGAAVCARR